MNQLTTNLIHRDGDRLYVTSLDISNRFQRRHDDILKAIRNLDCSKEFSLRNFAESDFTTERGKTYPMYKITEEGFSLLVMGFTGKTAMQWKERYIEAFGQMKKVLTPAVPAPIATTVEGRLGALETAMVSLASNSVKQVECLTRLVEVSMQQAQKLDVTARYIGLLEINQKGKVCVTRTIEAQVLALKAQGMPHSDIARLMRVSHTTVSLLVYGKYKFAAIEAQKPQEDIQTILDRLLAQEKEELRVRLAA